MKKRIGYFLSALSLGVVLFSCNKDLNRDPTHGENGDEVYSTMNGYTSAFAKVYGSLATTGNSGAGSGDIQGIDPGTSDYFRLLWYVQELSTDEAVVAWGDPGVPDFHNMNWGANNVNSMGLYYRCMYAITVANEFIRQSADDRVSGRGIKGNDAATIKEYQTEARFIRAFSYWTLMDVFGNPPFITEADPIGTTPKQITRSDLFNYVEKELTDIQGTLPPPKTNEYGRVDQAAAWALLARMYLNAKVYTGQDHYTDAATYASKVINAGYSLVQDYTWLMLADNNQNTNEFIWTLNYDGLKTQNYGGTTFMTHAAVGGSMVATDYGVGGGWAGIRTTKNLPNLFPDYSGGLDQRSEFYTNGQNIDIDNVSDFTNGFAVTKFKNLTRTGQLGSSLDFSDIDMPIFRLPEMYLIYAEAVLRGSTQGDKTTALGYINKLRERAYYGTNFGDITPDDLTLQFILDERARELYWEGFRRTDLIRYGLFTSGSYLWPWKGGVKSGTGVQDYKNLYPIPSQDLTANPNLVQNPGY